MDNPKFEGFGVTPDDFQRVENKVDQCLEAIGRLILIDERQAVQGQRMGQIEQRCAVIENQQQAQIEKLWEAIKTSEAKALAANQVTERKLDKWINFGLGAWSLAVTAFAIFQAISK